MRILNAEEIRSWDQFTIRQEPIASIDLMERAAQRCIEWLEKNNFEGRHFSIFCGKGNNGGDGLAIARLLNLRKYPVKVYILEFGHKGTEDFQTNLARLHEFPGVEIRFLQSPENFHGFEPGEIIIDALFGSGLNRGLDGVTAQLVDHINQSGCPVISIDIPSGMFVDRSSAGNSIINATYTLSFQCYKPALLLADNATQIGEVHILDIGLHPDFLASEPGRFELMDEKIIRSLYRPRQPFAHKGNYGHALLIAGSYGKMGAAVLAAKACLHSGVGLLSSHIPTCGYDILQQSSPETMVMTDVDPRINTIIEDDISKYESIGIGPGLGTAAATAKLLENIFADYKKPMVIDADALNIMAAEKELLNLIPAGSILTPHPKEFERLFGIVANDFERIELAIEKAKDLNAIIILKGHHTFIALPSQQKEIPLALQGYFNSTGNAGMATGGSGDVLTGILTGLLAQGYSPRATSILGVYLHGMAGDIAARNNSMEALIAGDIAGNLGNAFLHLSSKKII